MPTTANVLVCMEAGVGIEPAYTDLQSGVGQPATG